VAEIFISYSRSTEGQAARVVEALRELGYSVWRDDQLLPHHSYQDVTQERLEEAKAVLVLWSEEAVKSQWVRSEANQARERNKIVQVLLDRALPPMPFDQIQYVQLEGWSGDQDTADWRRVIQSISELVGRTPSGDVESPHATSLPPMASPPAARERLLAVLAFDNLSGDPEMAYFSDGVSEEIQQTVAQGSDLKVVARSSSFQFRGADKAVRKVAADLKATHLLDGSVRRSGERVRINAQLVECAGEVTLWSSRFDGDLSDVFALQDQIAEAVAHALKVALATPGQAQNLDAAIYELFLRARGALGEGGRLYDDAAADALPWLEEVVAAAPDHASAWELLARSRALVLRGGRRTGSYEEGRAGVLQAAEAALKLDPRRGGAYEALALLEPWGAYAQRERLLEQALAASPNDPDVLTEMSQFAWSVGRFRIALRFAERARELNPMMPAACLQVAQMRAYVGDYAGSVRMHWELHRRWPRNYTILVDLLNTAGPLGFPDEYREALDGIQHFEGYQGYFLRETRRFVDTLHSGDPELVAEILRRHTRLLEKSGTLPLNYLVALRMLGLTEEAWDLAAQADYTHVFDPDGPLPSGYFPGTIMGPWSELNRDPRFIDLADRLGLCVYWSRSDRWPDCVEWTPYDFKTLARERAAASR
jgi:TolB-like protein